MEHISPKNMNFKLYDPSAQMSFLTWSFPDYVNERACIIILNAATLMNPDYVGNPHYVGDPGGGGGGNYGGWGYGGGGGGRYGQAVDAEP